jgi:hypothetical protein
LVPSKIGSAKRALKLYATMFDLPAAARPEKQPLPVSSDFLPAGPHRGGPLLIEIASAELGWFRGEKTVISVAPQLQHDSARRRCGSSA